MTYRLRSSLRLLLFDVVFFGVMVGVGESYIQAFTLHIGAADVAAGLVITVPMLGGAVIQLISPIGVAWIGSYRRWVWMCASLQALSFVPLAIGALVGWIPTWSIFVFATLYWAAGLATGPAWNTWVGTIVPASIRARYFSRHHLTAQISILTSLLLAGFMLEFGKSNQLTTVVYVLLFSVAFAARLLSAMTLSRIDEPTLPSAGHRAVPVREILSRFLPGPRAHQTKWEGRAILYILAMTASLQIANPFITPFILRQLNRNYYEFTILLATVFLAKAAAAPLWGAIARAHGPARLLWIGAISLIPLPIMWIASDWFPYLVCIQIFTGVFAAAYELGIFLLFFETIHQHERTSVLSMFNLANAIANIAGSIVGGACLGLFNETRMGYTVIFAASVGARGFALLFLMRLAGVPLVAVPIRLRTLAVRIAFGSIERPILPMPQVNEAEKEQGESSQSSTS